MTMVTGLVRERQEYGGYFPDGTLTYQLSMRLHTLHCLIYYIAGVLVDIVCGLAVLLLISVAINILAIIYCVYRLRGKLTSSGGARSNVNPLY